MAMRFIAFMVRQSTTTDKTPEKIHQIGLQQVAEIEKQQLAIAKKLGFKDLKSFRGCGQGRTRSCTRSRASRFSTSIANTSAQMKPKLPKLFGRLPKAKLIVMPVEPFREKDASGAQYVAGHAGWLASRARRGEHQRSGEAH